MAGFVGPVVEPQLSRFQAATRGGRCGSNISQVFQHLSGSASSSVLAPGPLWAALLGEAHTAAADWCSQIGPLEQPWPAVFFADQSKAFERLSWTWFQEILRRWRIPPWLCTSFLHLVVDRSVRALAPGAAGQSRLLACGLGMGGPASPLAWAAAYDPIIETVATTLAAPCPTFVDDLAACVNGPAQTAAVQLLLMSASKCAGLVIAGHGCSTLWVRPWAVAWYRFFDPLPVNICCAADGWVSLSGLPVPFLCFLVARLPGGLPSGFQMVATTVPCHCALKSALVPASNLDQWRRPLGLSPLSASVLVPAWPDLGVQVGTRGSSAVLRGGAASSARGLRKGKMGLEGRVNCNLN